MYVEKNIMTLKVKIEYIENKIKIISLIYF